MGGKLLSNEKMARINQLARKSKLEGLTDLEMAEQQVLRKEYISAFRGSIENTLSNLTLIDPEGNDVTPEKVKQLRSKESLH